MTPRTSIPISTWMRLRSRLRAKLDSPRYSVEAAGVPAAFFCAGISITGDERSSLLRGTRRHFQICRWNYAGCADGYCRCSDQRGHQSGQRATEAAGYWRVDAGRFRRDGEPRQLQVYLGWGACRQGADADGGHGLLRGNFEYAVEVFPFWQSYTPTMQRQNCVLIPNPVFQRRRTRRARRSLRWAGRLRGLALRRSSLRWNFAGTRHWAPWMQGAGGLIWTNHKYPAFGGPPVSAGGVTDSSHRQQRSERRHQRVELYAAVWGGRALFSECETVD